MAGLIGSSIVAPKMMDNDGTLLSGITQSAPVAARPPSSAPLPVGVNTGVAGPGITGAPQTGGLEPKPNVPAPTPAPAPIPQYLAGFDPSAVTTDQIRQGLLSGGTAYASAIPAAQVEAFLQDPYASQKYQQRLKDYAFEKSRNESNAAGAAASQAVNASRNTDFQGTLNAMYGPNDPRRIASNYSEPKVNGTYLGPATNLPMLTPSGSPPNSFSPLPSGGAPTPTPIMTPTPTGTPTSTPIINNPGSGGQAPTSTPSNTPTPSATPTGTPTGTPTPSGGLPTGTTTGPTSTTGPGVTPGGPTTTGTQAANDIAHGYTASTAGTVNSQSTGYEAEKWEVTPEQQVEDRLNRILGDPDSSLMRQAKTQAMQKSNASGLINSSMAATAGEEAMIRTALPIAQQDAQTNANAAQTNAGATNNSRAFTAGASNTSSSLNAQLGTQTNAANAGEQNKAGAFTASAKNAAEALKIQTATQYYIKQLDVQTQKELQAMSESNKNLIQTNATAAEMNKSFAQNMLQIQNSTMTEEAKKTAINTQIWALNNGLKTIGHIIGFNLGKYWQEEDGTGNPIQLSTSNVGEGTTNGSAGGFPAGEGPDDGATHPGQVWNGNAWVAPTA